MTGPPENKSLDCRGDNSGNVLFNTELIMKKTFSPPSLILLVILLLPALNSGCAYNPPFTQQLAADMNFATVVQVANENGFNSYYKVSDYKGYSLLRFRKKSGGPEVCLIVDEKRQPVMRTLGYEDIDSAKLIHFVEDRIRHLKG